MLTLNDGKTFHGFTLYHLNVRHCGSLKIVCIKMQMEKFWIRSPRLLRSPWPRLALAHSNEVIWRSTNVFFLLRPGDAEAAKPNIALFHFYLLYLFIMIDCANFHFRHFYHFEMSASKSFKYLEMRNEEINILATTTTCRPISARLVAARFHLRKAVESRSDRSPK